LLRIRSADGAFLGQFLCRSRGTLRTDTPVTTGLEEASGLRAVAYGTEWAAGARKQHFCTGASVHMQRQRGLMSQVELCMLASIEKV
jgi:hypothetical protein